MMKILSLALVFVWTGLSAYGSEDTLDALLTSGVSQTWKTEALNENPAALSDSKSGSFGLDTSYSLFLAALQNQISFTNASTFLSWGFAAQVAALDPSYGVLGGLSLGSQDVSVGASLRFSRTLDGNTLGLTAGSRFLLGPLNLALVIQDLLDTQAKLIAGMSTSMGRFLFGTDIGYSFVSKGIYFRPGLGFAFTDGIGLNAGYTFTSSLSSSKWDTSLVALFGTSWSARLGFESDFSTFSLSVVRAL